MTTILKQEKIQELLYNLNQTNVDILTYFIIDIDIYNVMVKDRRLLEIVTLFNHNINVNHNTTTEDVYLKSLKLYHNVSVIVPFNLNCGLEYTLYGLFKEQVMYNKIGSEYQEHIYNPFCCLYQLFGTEHVEEISNILMIYSKALKVANDKIKPFIYYRMTQLYWSLFKRSKTLKDIKKSAKFGQLCANFNYKPVYLILALIMQTMTNFKLAHKYFRLAVDYENENNIYFRENADCKTDMENHRIFDVCSVKHFLQRYELNKKLTQHPVVNNFSQLIAFINKNNMSEDDIDELTDECDCCEDQYQYSATIAYLCFIATRLFINNDDFNLQTINSLTEIDYKNNQVMLPVISDNGVYGELDATNISDDNELQQLMSEHSRIINNPFSLEVDTEYVQDLFKVCYTGITYNNKLAFDVLLYALSHINNNVDKGIELLNCAINNRFTVIDDHFYHRYQTIDIGYYYADCNLLDKFYDFFNKMIDNSTSQSDTDRLTLDILIETQQHYKRVVNECTGISRFIYQQYNYDRYFPMVCMANKLHDINKQQQCYEIYSKIINEGCDIAVYVLFSNFGREDYEDKYHALDYLPQTEQIKQLKFKLIEFIPHYQETYNLFIEKQKQELDSCSICYEDNVRVSSITCNRHLLCLLCSLKLNDKSCPYKCL